MASQKLAPSATFDPTTLPPKVESEVPKLPDPPPAPPAGDRASIVAWLRAHRTAEPADHLAWRVKMAADIEAEKDKR